MDSCSAGLMVVCALGGGPGVCTFQVRQERELPWDISPHPPVSLSHDQDHNKERNNYKSPNSHQGYLSGPEISRKVHMEFDRLVNIHFFRERRLTLSLTS